MKVLEFLARLLFSNITNEGLIFKMFGTVGESGKLEIGNPIPVFRRRLCRR